MSPSVQWPSGTIGPLDLNDIVNSPALGSSGSHGPGGPPLAPPSPPSPPASPPPSLTGLPQCGLVNSPDNGPPPGLPWRGLEPADLPIYTGTYTAVLAEFTNPGDPNTSTPVYYLVDVAGTGFPPLKCLTTITTGTLGFFSTAQGTGSYLGALVNVPSVTAGASPSPSPSPSPPPLSPYSPPPPPPPPPPPECVHVCIDNWPVQSPTTVTVQPPPPPPPSPPFMPSEQAVTEANLGADNPADCLPFFHFAVSAANVTIPEYLQMLGVLNSNGDVAFIDQINSSINTGYGVVDSALKTIVELAGGVVAAALNTATGLPNVVRQLVGPQAEGAGLATSLSLLLGMLDKWVSNIPAGIIAPIQYYANYTMPFQIPSEAWANEAYARTFISEHDWKCLVRANGQQESWQAIDVKMRAHQPSELDLLLLWRKGEIANQQEFYEAMGVIGWTTTDSIDIWVASQAWVPSPTDAIEWMLKDVADPQIQETFLLGAEFQQKYAGHVKEVFDWNGISEVDANALWRAHWRNMAPTTLYELHKRLRPGWTALMPDDEVWHLSISICPRVPGIANFDPFANRSVSNGFPVPMYCEELSSPLDTSLAGTAYASLPGAPGQANPQRARAWLESLVTTGYHVSEGLGQSDYPPFWRQRLLAVSYRVMTRIDARRAYEVSAIDKDRLIAAFLDQGYSPPDALALYTVYFTAATQLHSRRPVCNQWVSTGYDINLLKASLISQGMREDMWDTVQRILIDRRRIKIQQECMAGIHKRFMKGMLDRQQATNELLNLRISVEQVGIVIDEWQCMLLARPKQETAAEICNEFRSGIITGKEAQQLLRAQGYNAFQARRILSLCYLQTPPKTRRHRPIPGSPLDAQMQQALDS